MYSQEKSVNGFLNGGDVLALVQKPVPVTPNEGFVTNDNQSELLDLIVDVIFKQFHFHCPFLKYECGYTFNNPPIIPNKSIPCGDSGLNVQ